MAAIFVKPTMDINDLYKYWKEVQQKWTNLYALLLYDKDQKEFRQYVINSYQLLDNLSGEDVFVFILDDLKNPNPPTEIFTLMRKLHMDYTKLPCLGFFENLNAKEIYIHQFHKDKPYSEQFKYIFNIARRCCQEHIERDKKFECLKSKLRIYKFKRKILPVLKVALKIAEKKISS